MTDSDQLLEINRKIDKLGAQLEVIEKQYNDMRVDFVRLKTEQEQDGKALAGIQDTMKWLVRLVIGSIISALLALLVIPRV